MKRLIKKTVALTAAFAMTLSLAQAALADSDKSGTITGDSQLEGFIDKNVYDITVPALPEGGLDFTLDPQGLLKVADSSKWANGAGSVYFKNAATGGGGSATYSDTSDDIVLINNSSFDIDVKCEVTLEGADEGINLVADTADLTSATEPSLYLGITTDDGAAAAITEATYTTTATTLTAVAEKTGGTEGYEVVAVTPDPATDETGSPSGYLYSYALSSGYDPATDGDKVTYNLTADCDSTADWSAIDTDVMTAKIVWSVSADELTPPDAAPSIAQTTINVNKGATSLDIPVVLGSGTLAATGIASITNTFPGRDTVYTMSGGYSFADGKITISGTEGNGRNYFGSNCQFTEDQTITLVITFDDAANTAVTVTLNVNVE